MTLPETIDTERLTLRPWALSDVEAVRAYAADEEWARYLPMPQPYTRADAEQFLARQILLDRRTSPSWAIELDATVIGGLNLRLHSDGQVGEIGYAVSRSHWRWGIATEAAQAILDEAFTGLEELARMRAVADVRNVASTRVMENIGMIREGLLRQNRLVHGALIHEVWYGILRPEWQATLLAREKTFRRRTRRMGQVESGV